MPKAKKRVPVTEERWEELNELKQAGQTYDELLKELIKEHKRRELSNKAKKVREADREELTELEDIDV